MTSEEYFTQVLTPNRDAYMAAPGSFVAAFNLASSLFHLRDWLFHEHGPAVARVLGMSFANEIELWSHIETLGDGFPYIRGVANASKHYKLRNPQGGITKVSDVRLGFEYGAGAYGVGAYGGPRIVVVVVGDETANFGRIADALYYVWRDLLEKVLGRAPLPPPLPAR